MVPVERGVEAHLYVREELPPPARERAGAVRTRGRELAEGGVLDRFDCGRWPKRVPVDDCDSALRDVYLSFAGWAADAGADLQPFFQTRVCYGPSTGERTDWLVLPAFALAVETDGELLAVYPHARDGETATVEDGLDALEAADGRDRPPSPERDLLVR